MGCGRAMPVRQMAPHLNVEAEEREYLAVEENDHAGVGGY